MKRLSTCIAVMASMAILSTAFAAEPARKLYRWVDKDGKVQFSDTLPPEAVDQARSEISARSGRVTAMIDRALTPEERELLEAREAAAAAERAASEKALETEQAMLGSFQTEDDLRRSFRIRQELLNQTLEAIEAGIASQRASLTSLLAQAAEAELAGTAVRAPQATTIRDLHREIGKQQQMLIVKQAELVDLDGELERLVKRFHELRGEPAAEVVGVPGSARSGEPDVAATPPTG